MKIERTSKEYGGGSGEAIFESDNFRVVVWRLSGGIKTTVACKLSSGLEIEFDGNQEFISDEACMEQFTIDEILSMINDQKAKSFKEGALSKVNEIRAVLFIKSSY